MLRAVDNKNLNVIGSIIADISLDGPMKPTEIIYICDQVLKGFFLSQTAIKNLTLVDPHFPKHRQEDSVITHTDEKEPHVDETLAECGCPI